MTNNLARLHLLDKKYDEAVDIALKGLPPAKDNTVKYSLYKNLGWAKLKQARYEEAEANLEEAIYLKGERTPAHCLLAQVLEAKGKTADAKAKWENCLSYASSYSSPEEDTWINLASQRLNAESRKP